MYVRRVSNTSGHNLQQDDICNDKNEKKNENLLTGLLGYWLFSQIKWCISWYIWNYACRAQVIALERAILLWTGDGLDGLVGLLLSTSTELETLTRDRALQDTW